MQCLLRAVYAHNARVYGSCSKLTGKELISQKQVGCHSTWREGLVMQWSYSKCDSWGRGCNVVVFCSNKEY